MTDTILSPNGVEAYTVLVIVVPGLGAVAPVGSLTPAQVQELRDDVQAVLNQTLDDLANVTEAGKADGMALVVQSDGTWHPEMLSSAISSVVNHLDVEVEPNVQIIKASNGLTAVRTGPAGVAIQPVYGGSGSATTVARSDHSHPPTIKNKLKFSKAAAVLSAGTSPLVDTTVSGLVPTSVYDVSIVGTLEAVNTNLSGRLTLATQIATNPAQTISRGFSGGVWVSIAVTGSQMSVTGVTSLRLQFWAEYESGDPTALYTGDLAWDIAPRGGTT